MTAVAPERPLTLPQLAPVRYRARLLTALLDSLAVRATTGRCEPGEVDWCLSAWTPLTGPARRRAWTELAETVALRDAVRAGLADWYDVEPDLTCPGESRQDVAAEIQDERAADAILTLTAGWWTR